MATPARRSVTGGTRATGPITFAGVLAASRVRRNPSIPDSQGIDEMLRSRVAALKLTPLAATAFFIGAFGWVQTTVVATLYMEEFFFLLAAVALAFTRAFRAALSEPVFRRLVLALLVTLAGYVISDLARESPSESYLRGWGRLVLTFTSFVGIALVALRDDGTIWWFALGRGLGGILSLKYVEHYHLFGSWKYAIDESGNFSSFGFAEYVGSAAVALVALLPPRGAVLALLALGAFSFHLDFRYHAGICMAVAFLLYLRAAAARGATARNLPPGRVVLAGTLALIALTAGYKLSENEGSAGRRAASDEGRRFGLMVGVRALVDSPFVGYGSWGRSSEIAALEQTVKAELGPAAQRRVITGSAAIVHSGIFQSWLEGGVLGAAFFVVFLYSLIRSFRALCLDRPHDRLLPILLYWYLFASWEVINAPFGANSRMHIALGAATLVIVAAERRRRVSSAVSRD